MVVSSEARISPLLGSTARWSLRQVRWPRSPCFSVSHSPAPYTFRPVESITTRTGPVLWACASDLASVRPGLRREKVVWSGTLISKPSRVASERSLGRDPDHQVPPLLQRPVIFRPVLDPVARPWDLVAARLIEPVGHRASSRQGNGPISLRRRPAQARERHFCTNAGICP